MHSTSVHQLPIRVYYEDTDAGGVVYHARYLHFFERARTEFLRQMDFSQQALLSQQQQAFVVRQMEIDFCLPAKLDDLVVVHSKIAQLKGASLIFEQQLMRQQQLLCQAVCKIAYVDLAKMKPMLIPQPIKNAMIQYL